MRLYSRFDPLAFQKYYAAKTLKAKRRAVSFETMDDATMSHVKSVWGGVNPWHSFYYTIGDKEKTHLENALENVQGKALAPNRHRKRKEADLYHATGADRRN